MGATDQADGELEGAGTDDDDEFPEDSAEGMLGAVSFDGLSPTAFEEFCFDLLSETGFVNVDWRKGTPKDSSPADRGRDIVAQVERVDVDGHQYMETWFTGCKHYARGVPPEALQGTLTWAQAESRPPFRIRTWEMPQLRRLLAERLDLAFRHDVQTETLRRVADILAAEAELTDRLWYGRKPGHDQPVPGLAARARGGHAGGPASAGGTVRQRGAHEKRRERLCLGSPLRQGVGDQVGPRLRVGHA